MTSNAMAMRVGWASAGRYLVTSKEFVSPEVAPALPVKKSITSSRFFWIQHLAVDERLSDLPAPHNERGTNILSNKTTRKKPIAVILQVQHGVTERYAAL